MSNKTSKPEENSVATYDQVLEALIEGVRALSVRVTINPNILLAALNTIRLEQEVVSQEVTREILINARKLNASNSQEYDQSIPVKTI